MGRKRRQYQGVRAASKTTIEIDFYYGGERRRERLKLEPTPINLKRAADHRAAILHSIDMGSFDPRYTLPNSKMAKRMPESGSDLTVKQLLHRWLDIEERHLKASTLNGYQKIIGHHLVPAFGELFLTDLTPKLLRDYLRSLSCGTKTQRNIVSPLRIAMDFAVQEDLIEANPLVQFRVKKLREVPKRHDHVDPLDSSERERLYGVLRGQNLNFIKFAFWTGLRTSELVALDWGDIDLQEQSMSIRRGLTQVAQEFETPKSKKGERRVKLLKGALEALRAQKEHTYLKGEEVFQDPKTKDRWDGDQPIRKRLWVPAMRRAGLRYRKPYQTRHTYASMCLTAGENVMWVAQQMGHVDWGFTARTYARYIESDRQDSGSKLEQWEAQQAKIRAQQSAFSQ